MDKMPIFQILLDGQRRQCRELSSIARKTISKQTGVEKRGQQP
jgi:hypothetical protein